MYTQFHACHLSCFSLFHTSNRLFANVRGTRTVEGTRQEVVLNRIELSIRAVCRADTKSYAMLRLVEAKKKKEVANS